METIVLSKGETKELLENTVSKAVQEEISEIDGLQGKEWLSAEEAQEYLGIDSRKLQYLRDTREIPFSQTGRTIFYPKQGLDEWLKENMPERWKKYVEGELTFQEATSTNPQ